MRSPNLRLLAGLLAGVVLLGAGVYVLRQYQVKRTTRALLARAERAEREGDIERAESDLRRYLGYQPADVEALTKYGLMIERRARNAEDRYRALVTFQQVLGRDPGRKEIRRRLVDLAVRPELKGACDPEPHLRQLLRDTPDDGRLEAMLAKCEEGEGKFAQARTDFERAVRHAPQEIDAYVGLANLLRTRINDAAGGDKVVEALVAANPRSARAYQARAAYLERWNLAGTGASLARARELAPDDLEVLLASARHELDTNGGRLDQARTYLERSVKLDPRDSRAYRYLAEVQDRNGRPGDAEATLRQGIAARAGGGDSGSTADDSLLKLQLTEMLIAQQQWATAKSSIAELRKARVLPEVTDFLDARILVGERQWREATRKLEELLSRVSHARSQADVTKKTLLLLAQCYGNTSQPDRAYLAYRRAVALDPLDLTAREGLASTLEVTGKLDEAIQEYRALSLKAPGASIPLARLLVQANLRLPQGQRNWDEPRRTLDRGAQSAPDSFQVPILRSEILFADGKPAEALKLLREACATHPDRVELWTELALLTASRETVERGLLMLDEAEKHLGDCVALRLARARLLAMQDPTSASKALSRLLQGRQRFDPEDQRGLLRGLAAAHLEAGDIEGAERLLTILADEARDDLASRLVLFDLALKSRRPQAIEHALAEIGSIEGEQGVHYRFARACQLIRTVKLGKPDTMKAIDESRRLLATVVAERPAWSRAAVAEAELDDLKGNREGAIKGYLRAIEDLGDRTPEPVQRVVQLLAVERRFREAEEILQSFWAKHDELGTKALRRLAAEVSLGAGHPDRALQFAHRAVSADSKDHGDLLWLSRILWMSGRRAEAGAAIRRATEFAPSEPEVWLALVRFVAATDRPKAEAAIREAEAKLSRDQSDLVLARCYDVIGQRDRARERYQAVLAERPEEVAALMGLAGLELREGRNDAARIHLRRIVDSKTADAGERSWGLQSLSLSLAASGDYQESKKALAQLGLLDQGRSAGARPDESPAELRIKARVLALQRDRSRRQEAIRILEGVIEREPPTIDDLDLLSQLYERDGHWPKARERLRSLMALAKGDPSYADYLAHFALRLLAHGETVDALGPLDQLKQVAPLGVATVEVEARAKKALGKDAEAVALVREFARTHVEATGKLAELLDKIGLTKPAEELYRKNAERSGQPADLLSLAHFVARHGRLDEALDLCERASKGCDEELLGQAAVAVLYANPPATAQIQRVDGWLQAAIGRHPKSAQLAFDLANLRTLEGRFDDAVELYRRCGELQPDESGPMNNLAWLLILHSGSAREALDVVNHAIERSGPIPELLDTRALAYIKLGRGREAVQDLEDALVIAPSAVLHYHLAQAQLVAKDRRAAEQSLRAARLLQLDEKTLHPLERPPYQQLVKLLTQK